MHVQLCGLAPASSGLALSTGLGVAVCDPGGRPHMMSISGQTVTINGAVFLTNSGFPRPWLTHSFNYPLPVDRPSDSQATHQHFSFH